MKSGYAAAIAHAQSSRSVEHTYNIQSATSYAEEAEPPNASGGVGTLHVSVS